MTIFKKRAITTGILIIVALGLAFFASVVLSRINHAYRNLDFFTFWLGGKLVGQGQAVYDAPTWVTNHALNGSAWIPNLYFVYPLTTAVFFVPLGFLPIEFASVIWLFATFIFIFAGLYLISNRVFRHFAGALFITLCFCLLVFRPVWLTLLMGQLDGFLLFLCALALVFFSGRHPHLAGIPLSLLVLKPNLGVPILACFIVWLLSHQQWRKIAVLSVSTLALLLLPLLIDPLWINKYISVGLYKSQDQNLYPSLRGLAGLLTHFEPTSTTIVWITLCVLLVAVVIFLLVKYRPNLNDSTLFAVSIPLSLLVTPYMRSYDFLLLLIPILMPMQALAKTDRAFIKITLLFMAFGILSFALVFAANAIGHDILSSLYPLAVLVYWFAMPKPEMQR